MKKLSDILDISPDITLETLQRARMAALTLIKWLLCSLFTGSFIGLIGALFYKALQYVTSFRIQHPYTLFFLPAAGIIIVLMYHFTHEDKNTGTNLVITAVQCRSSCPCCSSYYNINTAYTSLRWFSRTRRCSPAGWRLLKQFYRQNITF